MRYPDPALPASKNRYAVALYDSYNPEILFGEVLLIPQWTQTTLSQEEIRLNGGVVPSPQPIQPTEVTIQLYNPDQHVVVRSRPRSWNSAPYWEFEMPQESFRKPSSSILDRTQSDPTASEATPKINFKWRKDGKLSKDYVCALAGKSTNPDGSKKRHREPDITISLFRQLREITIYEPNLTRVEMEDHKGLELVILLGAAVIKDVYHGHLREAFNIVDTQRTNGDENISRTTSMAIKAIAASRKPVLSTKNQGESNPPLSGRPLQTPKSEPRPPKQPRSQRETDVETARLKKQAEHEERERKRAEHAETKRLNKMLEREEREARRKRVEIDEETERLKKLYGADQPTITTSERPQQNSAPPLQTPFRRPHSFTPRSSEQNARAQTQSQSFLQVPFSGSPNPDQKKLKEKKSFFGMRSFSDGQPQWLKKKQSSVW